jgi:hypothetical protein
MSEERLETDIQLRVNVAEVPIADIASRVLEKATKIPNPACHHFGNG